jgi:GNAT superfamily N-acetyltransferase
VPASPARDAIVHRVMRPDEAASVAGFVRRVYAAFVAPHESPEGRETFARYADALAARAADHRVWIALDGDAIVGALELRGDRHVSLLFVDGGRQRRGIARGLLHAAFGPAHAWPTLTVNSTPGAVDAYRRLGFVVVEPTREEHGLRFVPMRRDA